MVGLYVCMRLVICINKYWKIENCPPIRYTCWDIVIRMMFFLRFSSFIGTINRVKLLLLLFNKNRYASDFIISNLWIESKGFFADDIEMKDKTKLSEHLKFMHVNDFHFICFSMYFCIRLSANTHSNISNNIPLMLIVGW